MTWAFQHGTPGWGAFVLAASVEVAQTLVLVPRVVLLVKRKLVEVLAVVAGFALYRL